VSAAQSRPTPGGQQFRIGQVGKVETTSTLSSAQSIGDFERPDRRRQGPLTLKSIENPVGHLG
jgi:hypothetical protein